MSKKYLHLSEMRLLLLFILFPFLSFSQGNSKIKGVISDINSGEPIPFATVLILKTNSGAVSDIDGNYILEGLVPGNYDMEFSFVGYKKETKNVKIEKENSTIILNVFMIDNTCLLCEDPIVVSGTMTEVSKKESPVVVEVYSPAFLKKNPTPALFEALQTVNGVRPQINCSVCNTGDIHINGMEGPYTMVMIDGMPIVSGLSTVYGLNGIPNSLIDRVEVVKGPASTLYGSEAVGGLVNVITKSALNAPVFSADYFVTSWQEHHIDLGHAFKKKKVSSLLGINFFNYTNPIDNNGDNFTDLTLQSRLSIFNKWSFIRKDNRIANFAIRYVYEDRWGGEMQWKPEFRGTDSIYGESIYTNRLEMFGVYQLPMKESVRFQYSFSRHHQNSYYGITSYQALQNIGFGQFLWDKKRNNHQLLMGAGMRYTWYDDNTSATESSDTTMFLNIPDKNLLPGVFIQDEISLNENQKLLAGIRYDYHSRHGAIYSPRLNYKLSWKENILRIGVGNGFRVVNLFTEDHAATTGARDVIILENLEPEKSYNANLNFLHTFILKNGYIKVDGSLFYTYFTNKIIPDYTTNDNQIIYSNLDGYAQIMGASLNLEGAITNKWRFILGATVMNVEVNENGRIYRPLLTEQITGTFTISYKMEKIGWSIDYTGNLTGPMLLPLLTNDFRAAESPFFSIQNLQLTKTFKKPIEIYAGVKNLLNFRPADNSIMRPFDPFDKNINDPISNPNGYTFDPSYVYTSFQGIRAFVGFRYKFD